MKVEELAGQLMRLAGGKENIEDAVNCMTRLRIRLREPSLADVPGMMELEDVLILMPVTGWMTQGILWMFEKTLWSSCLSIRMVTGFLLASGFLTLVAGGYHHVLILLYALELQQLGEISLLPCLIMAGAGQVGAGLAVCLMARTTENTVLQMKIIKAIPPAFMGIGEPLVYGVTRPLRKPFLTAGLGAGLGGGLCLALNLRMAGWGLSGLCAVFLMKTPWMALGFLLSLFVSYLAGFLLTLLFVPREVIRNA